MHDIGKIGITDCILDKPRRLTNEEYSSICRHPVIGGNIVGKLKSFEDIIMNVLMARVIRNGLRGDDISMGPRIVAVADAFDAMRTLRSYRYGGGGHVGDETLRRDAI